MSSADFVTFALLDEPARRAPRLHLDQAWPVAVNVIDPRGNEGLRVITMPAD